MMSGRVKHVQLMDTTLRDGEQTQGVAFAPAEKVTIAKALLKSLNVDRIEVASARVSDGERRAVEQIYQWAAQEGMLSRIEVLGFVDHKRSVDWIKSAGGQVINLLAKGSLKHCNEQLRNSPEQHIADVIETVSYAQQQGLSVNLYLEDWSNGYANSPDYVYQMMAALQQQPIARFMPPDTLGVMTPSEVSHAISDMVQRFAWASFDFHPHNDYGLATANCMAAVSAGASSIHCTINCLGERAGNASLAEVAVVLTDKLHCQLQIDETQIHSISKMVENFSGKRVSDNTPIVGADVFTQTAGIHADGDKKGGLYHSLLSPERFERQRSYALGKMSGKASLEKNLEALGMSLADEDKSKVLAQIVKLADSKTQITAEDLPFIIADILEGKDYSHLELLNCSITSGLDLESTASIRVRFADDEEAIKASGIGNGGFDAFINAVKKTLEGREVVFPELVDYEVRIPPGGNTGALTECFITWHTGERQFRTRGVSANQVYAAIQATMRMINIQLHMLVEGRATNN